jgi:cell division protein FtsL
MAQDTNNYWEQLERLEKLIRASELKAGILFSFHSLILGLFVDRLSNFEHILSENILFLAFAILWLVCVIVSIYYCFKCFQPNMQMKYDTNVFFFRDAAREFTDPKDYVKEITKICETNEEVVKQLSHQIHAESVIIDKKFYNVKKAIQFFLLSFVFVVLMMSIWILVEVFGII